MYDKANHTNIQMNEGTEVRGWKIYGYNDSRQPREMRICERQRDSTVRGGLGKVGQVYNQSQRR